MRSHPSKTRRTIRRFGHAAAALGLLSFLSMFFAALGVFGPMREFAWPAGKTHDAIPLPDGRYAVPLEHVGRVQIYSADLQFQFGWNIEASGGAFHLFSTPDGKLEIYTARPKTHLFYDPDGTCLSASTYDYKTTKYPDAAPNAVSVDTKSGFWTFPFRGPFQAWLVGISGLLTAAATKTHVERWEERRAAVRFASRPSGPVGSVVRFAVACVAALIWLAGGVAWTVVCATGVVKSVSAGNIVAAVVCIPFTLIGCVIMFISMKIVHTAVRER